VTSEGKLIVALDIGGVLSKYPGIFRTLVETLLNADHVVHVVTDMHDRDDVLRQIRINGFGSIPKENVHCADYTPFGEGCKAEVLQSLNADIFIDDFMGYLCEASVPVRLLTMPDACRPYWADSWEVAKGSPEFGRRKYKK
jgi:hypothetical protein